MTHPGPLRSGPEAAPPTVAPGRTLGVVGGGQLARMFAQAAQRMGYSVAVLDPDPTSPAGAIAHHSVVADYADARGLGQLAALCAAVTTEFENVPAASLDRLAHTTPVAPGAAAVAVCQDRAAEKAHFRRSGIACAPNVVVDSEPSMAAVPDDLFPGVLKTARLGYDGKGQVRVGHRSELPAAWGALGNVVCILEKMLPLAHEISVVVARGASGDIVTLPVQQNLHRGGILAVTQVPCPAVSAELQQRAVSSAATLAQDLGYVGVLCVEFFCLIDGSLVVNEMAPRPHNSGHYSIDGCDVSQFELQVRTLAGLPLAPPRLHSSCVMLNLMGDLWFGPSPRSAAEPATQDAPSASEPATQDAPSWAEVLALPGVHLHLYGKAEARPGRKMGHLTITAATPEKAQEIAREAAVRLGIELW